MCRMHAGHEVVVGHIVGSLLIVTLISAYHHHTAWLGFSCVTINKL